MAAIREMNSKKREEFEVYEWVMKVTKSEGKDPEVVMNELIDKYGGHKDFIGYVGSFSVALAQEHKNKVFPREIEDFAASLKGERKETEFGQALKEMALTLRERSETLRGKIKDLSGTTEKKEVGKSVDEFFNDVAGKNPLKANDAMFSIREGAFSPEEIKTIMDKLLREYERAVPKGKKEVVLEERIRTLNAVLAGEYRDLDYQHNCEKNRHSS